MYCENAYLKQLLKQPRIESNKSIVPTKQSKLNEQAKDRVLPERIQIFKSLFRGRDDVYAVRWGIKPEMKKGIH